MYKIAGLEGTSVTDPASGLSVRVSTTTRKVYRYIYRNTDFGYETMRNVRLNEIIANDFANSSSRVVHHFKLGKVGDQDRITAEIRNRLVDGKGTVMFFISAKRGNYIDILTLQDAWRSKPLSYKKEKVILNNGELEYTYSEAEKKNPPISRYAFMQAIDCLTNIGLIDVVHKGSGGKKGDKSLYAISERWRYWGTEDFIENPRPKDTRKGRGWARYWEKKRIEMGNKKHNPTII